MLTKAFFFVFLCIQAYSLAETASVPVVTPNPSDKAVCWSGNDTKQVQILTRDGKGLVAKKENGGNFIIAEGKAMNQENFVSSFKMISKIGGRT